MLSILFLSQTPVNNLFERNKYASRIHTISPFEETDAAVDLRIKNRGILCAKEISSA